MPRSSASAVSDPYTRPTLLWPSAAVVKAQDELAALGLDDGPRPPKRSSYPGIWIRTMSVLLRSRTVLPYRAVRKHLGAVGE
jgi:hypothetical protein